MLKVSVHHRHLLDGAKWGELTIELEGCPAFTYEASDNTSLDTIIAELLERVTDAAGLDDDGIAKFKAQINSKLIPAQHIWNNVGKKRVPINCREVTHV